MAIARPHTNPRTQELARRIDPRANMVHLSTRVGRRLVAPFERWMGRASLVGDSPFLDVAQIPRLATLEEHWTEIRDELLGVLEDRSAIPTFQDISVAQSSISTDDRWKTYFLFGYGFEVEEHTAACPRTATLLREVPGMKTAMFSILAPGKHIPAHRGPYKGVLRYHLGLVVPEPAEQCRIRVHRDIRHWREGEGMLFDDAYEHEVWNGTGGERVVLFVDVERPLRGAARRVNSAILWAISRSSFVQDGRRRQREWTQALAARDR